MASNLSNYNALANALKDEAARLPVNDLASANLRARLVALAQAAQVAEVAEVAASVEIGLRVLERTLRCPHCHHPYIHLLSQGGYAWKCSSCGAGQDRTYSTPYEALTRWHVVAVLAEELRTGTALTTASSSGPGEEEGEGKEEGAPAPILR